MMNTCPKCKERDQEGEDVSGHFVLEYTCDNCGYEWSDADSLISNVYEQAKNLRKYGGL